MPQALYTKCNQSHNTPTTQRSPMSQTIEPSLSIARTKSRQPMHASGRARQTHTPKSRATDLQSRATSQQLSGKGPAPTAKQRNINKHSSQND